MKTVSRAFSQKKSPCCAFGFCRCIHPMLVLRLTHMESNYVSVKDKLRIEVIPVDLTLPLQAANDFKYWCPVNCETRRNYCEIQTNRL